MDLAQISSFISSKNGASEKFTKEVQMYLCKLKNNYYYVFYNAENGKKNKISTRTKRKSEAIKFLSNFQEQLKQREQEKFTSKSLKYHIQEFLKNSESIHSPKTTRDYRTTFNFFEAFIGNPLLSEITTKDINNYLELRTNKSSIYQSRKDLINISRFFNKAVQENYLYNSPCSKIKRIKTPEKQPLFFSQTDYDNLIEVIDNQDIKDITIFCVNTGLRKMELLTLEWNQINFKERYLILDNRNHLTKSKKVRTIPLNLTALQILTKREINKRGNLIFLVDGEQINPDKLTKLFKGYIKRAKINNKLNFHSLRHTFASWLVQKGVSIYLISKLLGHSDIKITEIYSHLRNEDLINTVTILDK